MKLLIYLFKRLMKHTKVAMRPHFLQPAHFTRMLNPKDNPQNREPQEGAQPSSKENHPTIRVLDEC